jgi:thioredoxin 1
MNIIKAGYSITLACTLITMLHAKEECLMGAIDIVPSRSGHRVIDVKSMSEFNRYKNAGKPMVVKCYTSWCGPCKELKEPYEQLAKEYGASINFLAADGDHAPDIMRELKVEGYPTIIFFDRNGGQLFSRIGGISKGNLIDLVEQLKNGGMQKQGAGKQKQVIEKEKKEPVAAPAPAKEESKKPTRTTRAQAKRAAQQKKSAPQQITRRGPGGKKIRYVAIPEEEDEEQ